MKRHSICQFHSDAEIMQWVIEGIKTYLIAISSSLNKNGDEWSVEASKAYSCCRLIASSQLTRRLKRQKIPQSVYRRRIKKYMRKLEGCQLCHNYIGEYPNS